MIRGKMTKNRNIRTIDENSPYSMSAKAIFSAFMILLTPFTLGFAFYAVYKNPVFVPLIFIALIPAGLSCIGITGLRRLFRGGKHNRRKTTNQ
jgi:predicted Co/Zn/Cd cation transporter (cation efflux family)